MALTLESYQLYPNLVFALQSILYPNYEVISLETILYILISHEVLSDVALPDISQLSLKEKLMCPSKKRFSKTEHCQATSCPEGHVAKLQPPSSCAGAIITCRQQSLFLKSPISGLNGDRYLDSCLRWRLNGLFWIFILVTVDGVTMVKRTSKWQAPPRLATWWVAMKLAHFQAKLYLVKPWWVVEWFDYVSLCLIPSHKSHTTNFALPRSPNLQLYWPRSRKALFLWGK